MKWEVAPETAESLTFCWACFTDVEDDILEAEATMGVAVCYNSEDEFKSLGSVIATGENSFTYVIDGDGE